MLMLHALTAMFVYQHKVNWKQEESQMALCFDSRVPQRCGPMCVCEIVFPALTLPRVSSVSQQPAGRFGVSGKRSGRLEKWVQWANPGLMDLLTLLAIFRCDIINGELGERGRARTISPTWKPHHAIQDRLQTTDSRHYCTISSSHHNSIPDNNQNRLRILPLCCKQTFHIRLTVTAN